MYWDNGIRNIRNTVIEHIKKNGNSMVKNVFDQLREDEKDEDYRYSKTCNSLTRKIKAAFQKKFPFFAYFLLCLDFTSRNSYYSNCEGFHSITTDIPSYDKNNVNGFFILLQDIELFLNPTVCRDVVIFDSCKQVQTSPAYCSYDMNGIWNGGTGDYFVMTAGRNKFVEKWSEDNCQTWHKAGEIKKTTSNNFKIRTTFQICP